MNLPPMLYLVHAHLNGDPDAHTYLVGIYTDAKSACETAIAEERFTIWRYSCTIQARSIDTPSESLIWIREQNDPQFDKDTQLLLQSLQSTRLN